MSTLTRENTKNEEEKIVKTLDKKKTSKELSYLIYAFSVYLSSKNSAN
jgi:hypothetical protein